MSWYTTGSVNLTNGSKTVTGVGTKWTNPLIGICAGQMLILKTTDTIEICEIASVQSDTQLTLANKYEGVTKTGVNYEIPTVPNVSVEHLALRISEMLNYYQQQMEGWQTVLTGEGEVTLTAPDGRIVTIKSQYSIQDELIKLVEKGKNFSEIAIKNAELSNNASQSAKNSESSAKTSADNAAKFADSASQSAKNAGNSATSAKTAETGAQTSAKEAKQSALDAKNWASTVDTTTFVKKSGDDLTGRISINGKSVLTEDDAQLFYGNLLTRNLNDIKGRQQGNYFQNKNENAKNEWNYPITVAGTLSVMKTEGDGVDGCVQIYTDYAVARQFIRTYRDAPNLWSAWVEQITTANASADIVGALPAVKTSDNNAPTYKVGNQVDFSQTPTVNGQPVVTDLSGVQGQIALLNNNFSPIYTHMSVIPHETEGRTDIASSGYQSIFSIRDDGVCGMWNSQQQRWRFLFDQNGNLVVGNICYNQSWHNLTNERQSGVVYLNTIGKPIMISISSVSGNIWVSNVEVARVNGTGNQVMSAVIPDGFAYAVNGEFVLWSELR